MADTIAGAASTGRTRTVERRGRRSPTTRCAGAATSSVAVLVLTFVARRHGLAPRARAVLDRLARPRAGVRRRVPPTGRRRLPHRLPHARRRRRDMPWWPFTKNMSSRESIIFVSDSLFLNPLELLIGVDAGRVVPPPGRPTRPGTSSAAACSGRWSSSPASSSSASLRGDASGGDPRVADLRGSRPLIYMLDRVLPRHERADTRTPVPRLLLCPWSPSSIQSIFSLNYYAACRPSSEPCSRVCREHSATIHMDALFILLVGSLGCFGLALRCAGCRRCWRSGRHAPTSCRSGGRRWSPCSSASWSSLVVSSTTAAGERSGSSCPRCVVARPRVRRRDVERPGAIGLPAQAVKTVLVPRPARRRRPQLGHLPRDRGVRTSGSRSAEPAPRRRVRSEVPRSRRRCPTSASSSSGSTCRTTPCCGSGSRRASSASSRCCSCSAGRAARRPLDRSSCARRPAAFVARPRLRRDVPGVRLRRHRAGIRAARCCSASAFAMCADYVPAHDVDADRPLGAGASSRCRTDERAARCAGRCPRRGAARSSQVGIESTRAHPARRRCPRRAPTARVGTAPTTGTGSA